jgi:ATP-dependent helicase/nuclease subunit A
MTRAENSLYVSAALPARTAAEKEASGNGSGTAYDEAYIRERLSYLAAKKEPAQEEKGAASFFDLLLPSLVRESPLFTLTPIPVYSRQELRRRAASTAGEAADSGPGASMSQAAEDAAPFYEGALTVVNAPHIPGIIPASSLHYAETEAKERPAPPGPDPLLEETGLDAAEFGTIAHAFLEDRFSGREPLIPAAIASRLSEKSAARIKAAALSMTTGFLDSELGRLAQHAAYREMEFPFITRVETKPALIRGKIDLLFESDGVMYVVDFKTDRIQNPPDHYGQLAAYRRAVSDIYEKPVRAYLYYLRDIFNGKNDVEVSDKIKDLDIDGMAGELH